MNGAPGGEARFLTREAGEGDRPKGGGGGEPRHGPLRFAPSTMLRMVPLPRLRRGRNPLAAALATLALAACQTSPTDYLEYRSRQDPMTTASRIADNVGRCWFSGERTAFADYSYAPELASVANRPRVLIVPADNPTGLPVLVIEASRESRETRVKLFGPLMASAEAGAIARDVERWSGGATDCS